MCGIAGELNWSRAPETAAVRTMAARLSHRGPDAEGFVERGPIAFGHRRLTIIDVSEASNQPLHDGSSSIWIVYNGEIYNFRELRRELEAAGAGFRTSGDTEVIVEAYRFWGTDFVRHLNGMFAFALWDETQQRLILARDRVGEKPLYFQRFPDGLIFASELQALLAHPRASRAIEPEAIGQFLALNYTCGPQSILAGIERLPAGALLDWQRQRAPQLVSYWDLAAAFRSRRRFANEGEAAEELDGLLDDSVRLRLVSDVPLGAFLSGGVDSSIVVESMARSRPPRQNLTFSIGFGEGRFSELPKARRVARHLGVEHRDRVISADMASLLPEIVRAAGEPFADGSMIPFYYLARFAREKVKVCLSGDGADEIFAGYETYAADRLHRALAWLPGPLTAAGAHLIERLWPVRFDKVSFDYRLRQFSRGLGLDFRRAHHHWRQIFSLEQRRRLLRPEHAALAECDGFEVFARRFEEVAGCHYLDQAMYVDIKTWLVDDILVKVDRASMAHSLESRAPFLDHRLVEFAASLPIHLKIKGLRKKHLLRKARAPHLPPGHLDQRKEGFGAPLSHWLLGPFGEVAERAIQDGPLHDWIRQQAVATLWRQHRAGSRDHSYRLFGLACLSLWLAEAL